jgi:hypothetical protein
MSTFQPSAFSALPRPRLAQNGINVTPRLLDFISAESSAQRTKQARLVPDWGCNLRPGARSFPLFSPDPTPFPRQPASFDECAALGFRLVF